MEAIETDDASGKLLTFDQPRQIAGFVHALGAVATKRQARLEKDLGGKEVPEMMTELMAIPAMRTMLFAELSKDPSMREALKSAMGDS